ncbi:hypothetical protein BJX66DRAFT_148481 [Aspergillus keveii]|jgi:hypothetical protein|uniref:Uncharacterized protein n=1 Tax=Aspergillus keveii TaxID=714993 RepID=A0ABR4GMX6_9EURO
MKSKMHTKENVMAYLQPGIIPPSPSSPKRTCRIKCAERGGQNKQFNGRYSEKGDRRKEEPKREEKIIRDKQRKKSLMIPEAQEQEPRGLRHSRHRAGAPATILKDNISTNHSIRLRFSFFLNPPAFHALSGEVLECLFLPIDRFFRFTDSVCTRSSRFIRQKGDKTVSRQTSVSYNADIRPIDGRK